MLYLNFVDCAEERILQEEAEQGVMQEPVEETLSRHMEQVRTRKVRFRTKSTRFGVDPFADPTFFSTRMWSCAQSANVIRFIKTIVSFSAHAVCALIRFLINWRWQMWLPIFMAAFQSTRTHNTIIIHSNIIKSNSNISSSHSASCFSEPRFSVRHGSISTLIISCEACGYLDVIIWLTSRTDFDSSMSSAADCVWVPRHGHLRPSSGFLGGKFQRSINDIVFLSRSFACNPPEGPNPC